MKGFAAGACRRAYVATICALSRSYAQSAASQTAIRVAATTEILFGKNCRTCEIWGLKIASEHAGPAEPVQLLRPRPDQFLRLSKDFRAATCSCRLEICVLVICKLSAGDARLM